MKKAQILALFLGMASTVAAQFGGILTYDCTIKNKTITTLYEAKNKVLLEAKIYPMKGGAADIREAKEQDPLLFDFEAKKVTRVGSRHREVVTSDMAPVTNDRNYKAKDDEITVTAVGAEKVNDYNCQHFNVKIKNTTVDVWITKELGASSICMLSLFDYYPAGSALYEKLKAAGGDGVMVKSQSGDQIVNLTNAQIKAVPASYFDITAKKP